MRPATMVTVVTKKLPSALLLNIEIIGYEEVKRYRVVFQML